MRENSVYKKEAKELFQARKGKVPLIWFLYGLIVSVVGSIGTSYSVDEETGAVTTQGGYGSIITFVVAGAFAVSLALIVIKVVKSQEVETRDLFAGFKDFLPAFLLSTLTSAFIALWSLLFIVPGIIMSFAYSMVYFIHIDHKELKPIECIKKSRAMMKGHKGQLFGLYLSYFGELLLCIVTLGIYTYWLAPKIETAQYLFYLDLKKENGEVEEVFEAE